MGMIRQALDRSQVADDTPLRLDQAATLFHEGNLAPQAAVSVAFFLEGTRGGSAATKVSASRLVGNRFSLMWNGRSAHFTSHDTPVARSIILMLAMTSPVGCAPPPWRRGHDGHTLYGVSKESRHAVIHDLRDAGVQACRDRAG